MLQTCSLPNGWCLFNCVVICQWLETWNMLQSMVGLLVYGWCVVVYGWCWCVLQSMVGVCCSLWLVLVCVVIYGWCWCVLQSVVLWLLCVVVYGSMVGVCVCGCVRACVVYDSVVDVCCSLWFYGWCVVVYGSMVDVLQSMVIVYSAMVGVLWCYGWCVVVYG